jgi:branched-chain amino acid aminotransferase
MHEKREDIIVWFENNFVRLGDANVNILTHGLNYGTGVFEGIRGYWSEDDKDLLLVHCEAHYRRWKQNCRMIGIEPAMSETELAELTVELCRRNQFKTDVYVRPLAYMSSPRIGVRPDGVHDFAVIVVPMGVYMDSTKGLHAGVSSWRRISDAAMPCRAKVCGAYVNSVLATTEVHRNGFDEAIFLNADGHVAEAATCNVFMVRGNRLLTPPPSDDILEGITRASVMELAARELHIEVVERSIDRTELYVCDELFLSGTAVEVAPITKVDHRPVGAGAIGPVTSKLRELYFQATRAQIPEYYRWLQPVYQPLNAPAA